MRMFPILALSALALVGCKKQAPSPAAEASGDKTCDQPDVFGPVRLSAAQAEARYAQGHRDLTTLETSKAQPVEVCGVPAQLTWLTAAQCADGSNPFADSRAAHASRDGNVGAGGRCGTIIDLYKVPCPEQTYDVYMDAYHCGPGESLR